MEKVVLFDFDGVIADSIEVDVQIYGQIREKFNLPPLTRESFASLFSMNFYQAIKTLGISDEHLEEYLASWSKLRDESTIPLCKGIKEVLEFLKKYSLYIVTASPQDVVTELLESNNIVFFKEIYGKEKGRSKVKKINKIKETYPDATFFFITDSTGDIREGQEAGVITIAVPWGIHNEEVLLSAGPDYIAKKPEEILDIID